MPEESSSLPDYSELFVQDNPPSYCDLPEPVTYLEKYNY